MALDWQYKSCAVRADCCEYFDWRLSGAEKRKCLMFYFLPENSIDAGCRRKCKIKEKNLTTCAINLPD